MEESKSRALELEIKTLRWKLNVRKSALKVVLQATPHPGPGFAKRGKTFWDYTLYVLEKGRKQALKKLDKAFTKLETENEILHRY